MSNFVITQLLDGEIFVDQVKGEDNLKEFLLEFMEEHPTDLDDFVKFHIFSFNPLTIERATFMPSKKTGYLMYIKETIAGSKIKGNDAIDVISNKWQAMTDKEKQLWNQKADEVSKRETEEYNRKMVDRAVIGKNTYKLLSLPDLCKFCIEYSQCGECVTKICSIVEGKVWGK